MSAKGDASVSVTPNPTSRRSASKRQRCSFPGCRRWALGGSPLCSVHREPDLRPADASRRRQARAEQREASQAFLDRLEAGDYRDLWGPRLHQLVREAAKANGVDDELGALRIVLAQLVSSMAGGEGDPVKLAGAIARVASTSLAARRTQRLMSGQAAADLTDALTEVLMELSEGVR